MTFSNIQSLWHCPSRYSYQISLMNWQGHRCASVYTYSMCAPLLIYRWIEMCVHVLACLEVHACIYWVQIHVLIWVCGCVCVSVPRSQCSDEVYCSLFCYFSLVLYSQKPSVFFLTHSCHHHPPPHTNTHTHTLLGCQCIPRIPMMQAADR